MGFAARPVGAAIFAHSGDRTRRGLWSAWVLRDHGTEDIDVEPEARAAVATPQRA